MLRLTTLKMSLLSALATLFLLVAMLASTGTASAHTASNQTTAFPHHPHIVAYNTTPMGGDCEKTQLDGSGFAPGFVHLVAWQHGQSLSVQPAVFFTPGSFTLDVTICGGFGLGHHHHGLGWPNCFSWPNCYGLGYGYGLGYAPTTLIAIGPYGVHSNPFSLQ